MKLLMLLCGLAVVSFGQATAVGCKVYLVSPESSIEVYNMRSCADAQFKGGGIVIRYLIDANLWPKTAIVYYPGHRIRRVTIQEVEQ